MSVTDEVYTITAQDAAANGSAPRKGFSTSAMRERQKVVTVEFDGMTGDVWYRPWVVTPRVMREIDGRRHDEDQDSIGRIMDQLVLFVTDWEVLDEAGQHRPVTVDVMEQHVPNPLLLAMLNAIIADMRPSPTTGDGSFSG